MPGLVRPKDIIKKLDRLSDKQVCEMYARLFQRAFETNPLREWKYTLNPTREDLADVLGVLPPADMANLEEQYFE